MAIVVEDDDYFLQVNDSVGDMELIVYYPETEIQNVLVLSLVLLVALAANLMALPVILFRRTKVNDLFYS